MNTTTVFPSFDGTDIAYEVGGDGTTEKATLLFLHGLGGNMRAWDAQRSYFQHKGYQTVAFDLRGHGLSAHPKHADDYSLDAFAQDIQTFLNVHPLKNIVLIGHCLGGMIVLKLAARMTIKPKAIIVIATSPHPSQSHPVISGCSRFLHATANLLLKSPIPLGNAGQTTFERFLHTGDFDPKRILSDIVHTTLPSYLAICGYLPVLDDDGLLPSISCPTLIIHGAKDRVFPVSTASHLHEEIKTSSLVILPTANHVIPINNPEELTYHVESYLNRLHTV